MGGLTILRSETGRRGGHKPEGGCLHPYSFCSIHIGSRVILLLNIHHIMWHPPRHCHATPVQHVPPPPTVPGVHSLKPVCVPSAVGPMFCQSGVHTLWGTHCRGSCRLLLSSATVTSTLQSVDLKRVFFRKTASSQNSRRNY